MMIVINSYDIDGVIYMGPNLRGLVPEKEDVIITGRSFEQREATLKFLHSRGIFNMVFFNPLSRHVVEYGRNASGKHKRRVIEKLHGLDIRVALHFEDDPVQAEFVKDAATVVMIGNQEFVESKLGVA